MKKHGFWKDLILASKELPLLLRAFSYDVRLMKIDRLRGENNKARGERLEEFAREIRLPGYEWRKKEEDSDVLGKRWLEGKPLREADELEKDIREYLTNRKGLFFAGAAVFLGGFALFLSILFLIVNSLIVSLS